MIVFTKAPSAELEPSNMTLDTVVNAMKTMVYEAMSAAATVQTEEVAMTIPYRNLWCITEFEYVEFFQLFYKTIKSYMLFGISKWTPKRLFVITPTSDDKVCDVMVRAVNTDKLTTLNDEKLAVCTDIEYTKDAVDRINALARMHSNDHAEIVGRKVVAVAPDRSPPRRREE